MFVESQSCFCVEIMLECDGYAVGKLCLKNRLLKAESCVLRD